MQTLESALETIFGRLSPLASEAAPLPDACGRILAEGLVSSMDLPAFDNSAMDGYAVRAADTAGSALEHPVVLRLAGSSAAGQLAAGAVGAGQCARVFTGAPLPAGADAVIMQEDTGVDANDATRILIRDGVKPWENVRFRGEDVKRGAAVLAAGDRLTPGRIGLAAALGCATVNVGRRPVVSLLATGNELVEPGQPLAPGQIYESNRSMLAPLVARAGGICRVMPLVSDSLDETKAALSAAFEGADAVITSGGVSVGELDFVKPAFEALGGHLEFWRVAIKPGKPFVFGELHGKHLFGLPGNPVSALVTFLMLVRPALLRLQGASAAAVEPARRRVVAGEPFVNRGDRRHFMRACVDSAGQLRPSGPQASHRLGSLAGADGLADVPSATTIAPGDLVDFVEFGWD